MEKQCMSVEELRKFGRWQYEIDNHTILPPGIYEFGSITTKKAEINGSLIEYPIIEIKGHGYTALSRFFNYKVDSEKPILSRNGTSWYFKPTVVSNFSGDIAVVACQLQYSKVRLNNTEVLQQTGFAIKGKPWTTEEEAIAGAKLMKRRVYVIEKIL